jgi:S-adenosylmethionine hydrolase
MKPSGIITLLSDFGTQDAYVGAMKGTILRQHSGVSLVDITHEVRPFAILQGAFLLDSAWSTFPAGTVHLAVVDPGVGGPRTPIAMAGGDHFFVGPDNGLFTFVLERIAVQAVALPVPASASATFHGRDVFAPAAARLAAGTALHELGSPVKTPTRLGDAWAVRVGEGWRAHVLHCDRFGNVITNLPASSVGRIHAVNGVTVRAVRTYEEAPAGELVVLAGSASRVEVAIREGSATTRLRANAGDAIIVT